MANILTCYYRPKPGGLCKRLFRTIKALLKDGHTVHYLSVIPFPIKHPNCHFHRFPWPSDKTEKFLFWGVFQLLAPIILLYIGYKHRITHTFSFGYTYSFLMQPLRLIKRIPSSLFARADTLENHRLKGRSRWLLVLEKWLEGFGIANVRFYGVSDSLTHSIPSRHRFLKPKSTGTLRNDIEKWPSRPNAKHNFSFPLRLACVGILEKRKNQHFLLEVIENVDPQKAQLYLYGLGPEEKKLKRIVRQRRINTYVHFMGWVEVHKIWQNIDLLLMPSLHEGAPNSVLEAMSYGVPALVSYIPEHKEILPEASLLLLDDPMIWANRLHAIIEDPDLELKKLLDCQEPHANYLTFDWDREICICILDG